MLIFQINTFHFQFVCILVVNISTYICYPPCFNKPEERINKRKQESKKKKERKQDLDQEKASFMISFFLLYEAKANDRVDYVTTSSIDGTQYESRVEMKIMLFSNLFYRYGPSGSCD